MFDVGNHNTHRSFQVGLGQLCILRVVMQQFAKMEVSNSCHLVGHRNMKHGL